eukprot:jgi/Bigna1/78771/fgenesh1_pg.57_\
MEYSTYDRIADDGDFLDDASGKRKGRSRLYDGGESNRIAATISCCFLVSILLIFVGIWQIIRARNLQLTTTREHCQIVGRNDRECYYDCACDGDGVCMQCRGVESTYTAVSPSKCSEELDLVSQVDARRLGFESEFLLLLTSVLISVQATPCFPRPQFRIGDIVPCYVPNCDEQTMYLGSPNHDYFAAVLCLALGALTSCTALSYTFFRSSVSV